MQVGLHIGSICPYRLMNFTIWEKSSGTLQNFIMDMELNNFTFLWVGYFNY